jgi:hypothetical protein
MPTPTQDSVFEDAATIVTPLVAADATKRENVVDRFMAGLPTYDESSEAPVPPPAATGASPTGFTPAGAAAPANLAAMTGIVANPATAWAEGASVTLGDASKAHWNGTAWVAGVAPAAAP